ncbi:MAG: comEC [Microgenomates bacterium 39_7]|nr:MAG: comEC [Microgenomates bacterium 39_7]
MNKRFFPILIFLGTILALIWFWPSKNFRVVFCDVGQGDAILFSYRNYQILVDGGANNRVLECLNDNIPFWDRNLEMVILTHPDKDHYQGLISVAERYILTYFVWGGLEKKNDNFEKLLAQLSNQNVILIKPNQNDEIAVDKMKIRFYWPDPKWLAEQLSDNQEKMVKVDTSKDYQEYQKGSVLAAFDDNSQMSFNDFSLIFTVSFADFDILMMGDADSRIQPQILKSIDFPDVEVLKVAHHGSRYAFDDDFLASFKAVLAVISVGTNPWGHPHPDLLSQLDQFGLAFLRTDEEGSIKLASDGRVWWREE